MLALTFIPALENGNLAELLGLGPFGMEARGWDALVFGIRATVFSLLTVPLRMSVSPVARLRYWWLPVRCGL